MQGNTVAYDEGGPVQLERKLLLEDAISDLPAVKSSNCYCWVWFTLFFYLSQCIFIYPVCM